jgi:hypothetical protein
VSRCFDDTRWLSMPRREVELTQLNALAGTEDSDAVQNGKGAWHHRAAVSLVW